MIYLKSKEDIEAMRAACWRVALILDELSDMAQKCGNGITTGELDRYAEKRCEELNCTPAFKGYRGFPASVCISINEEAIHGIPSDKRFIKAGDIVGLDFGVVYNGWYGDSARTVPIGEISLSAKNLLKVTKECLTKGIEQCRAGNYTGDIGYAIQRHAEKSGYSVVKQFCGHGIGRSLHEDPNVLNYGKKGTGVRLEVGMVLALEPIINIGKPDIDILSDGWTVVTKDRSLSAHFEHTIAITQNGPVILTKYKGNK